MEKDLLRVQRIALKASLCKTRIILADTQYWPECAYCGKPLVFQMPDMHEVFFPRGMFRGVKNLDTIANLYQRENCVLVHPGGSASPCHGGAHTREGKIRTIAHLLKWEGEQALRDYVEWFAAHLREKDLIASEALDLIRLAKELRK